MAKKLFYKIGDACKAVDIQPYVLRYWETEFPFLNPSKSKSGQRVYSEHELDIIRRIKQLLYEEQYTTAGAKKKLEAELADGNLGGSKTEGGEAESAGNDGAASVPAASSTDSPLEKSAKNSGKTSAKKSATTSRDTADGASSKDSPAATDTANLEALDALRTGIESALGEARELLASLEGDVGRDSV